MGRLKELRSSRLTEDEPDKPKHWDISGIRIRSYRRTRSLNFTRLQKDEPTMCPLVLKCLTRTQPGIEQLLKDPQLMALKEAFNGQIYIELK